MKDEELFKAWKSEQYKDQSTEERMEFVEHLHTFPKYFEKTFLAGLKAGRPQWHDINDTEPSKEQLGKQLLIRMESVIGDTDYDYLVYKYSGESITDVPDVIAWCEIPTFDKE